MIGLSPLAVLIPVAIGGAVVGVVAWVKRTMAPEPSPIPDPEPDKKAPDGGKVTPDQKAASSSAICKRTGKAYDSAMFHSPAAVVATLNALGYPAPDLTSSAGKAEVVKFQTMAVSLGLPGLKDAGPEWIDGKMGACTLIALAEAKAMLDRGHWSGPG